MKQPCVVVKATSSYIARWWWGENSRSWTYFPEAYLRFMLEFCTPPVLNENALSLLTGRELWRFLSSLHTIVGTAIKGVPGHRECDETATQPLAGVQRDCGEDCSSVLDNQPSCPDDRDQHTLMRKTTIQDEFSRGITRGFSLEIPLWVNTLRGLL